MIDAEQAKERVAVRLGALAKLYGSPMRIVEPEIKEYEWGWVIGYEPVDRDMLPAEQRDRFFFPFMVDRVTGHIQGVGTSGLKIAVWKLLEKRPEGYSRHFTMEPLNRQRPSDLS